MNKKLNSILFLVGATLVNILILLVLLAVGFMAASWLLGTGVISAEIGQMLMIMLFVGAIIGAFFIYNKLMKIVSSKVDMEKYFDPMFLPKKK